MRRKSHRNTQRSMYRLLASMENQDNTKNSTFSGSFISLSYNSQAVTDTDTHTDTHRHTQTHTDTHRHTQTHTDTQTYRHRHRHSHTHILTFTNIDRHRHINTFPLSSFILFIYSYLSHLLCLTLYVSFLFPLSFACPLSLSLCNSYAN